MTQKSRQRLVVVCSEDEFEIINDVLYQHVPEILEGMGTHFKAENASEVSIFIPIEWPEGKLYTMQFLSLD